MRADVFVYLAGPITPRNGSTVEDNVAAALRVYWRLLQAGIPCFCPQLVGAFPTAWSALPYERWIEYDRVVIDRCSHLLLLEGWQTSRGACSEREYANAQGLPVVHSVDDLLRMVAAA